MTCITVTEVDCDTAVLVQEDTAQVVQLIDTDTVVVLPDETSTVVIDDSPDIVTQEEQVTTIVTECLQGPQGPKGDDGTAAQQINASVAQGAQSFVDTLSLANNPSAKWLITAIDSIGNLRRMSEVSAIHNGTDVKWVQFGIIGDDVKYKPSVVLSGGIFFQLLIQNNHSEDLDFKILRLSAEI